MDSFIQTKLMDPYGLICILDKFTTAAPDQVQTQLCIWVLNLVCVISRPGLKPYMPTRTETWSECLRVLRPGLNAAM